MASSRSDFEPDVSSSPVKRPKSPPLAFAMTPNDMLHTPKANTHASDPFYRSIDYITSTPGSRSIDLEIQSPLELDLEGQLSKQTEALRLQHQAFAVERECWEMERDRLHRRIAALETLLKSPRGCSPAKSPDTIPPTHSAPASISVHPQRYSSVSSAGRLPSIAEHETSPEAQKDSRNDSILHRDNAPSHIEIPDQAIPNSEVKIEPGATTIILPEDPPSPPTTTRIMSPPPPEYVRHAGHTPLRGPSRPTSSSSYKAIAAALDDTPTRRNTARNVALSRDEDGDHGLIGPLKLPELPNAPDAENFTIDALTTRLQYIENHPDENRPLALSAKVNWDAESDVDNTDLTLKASDDDNDRSPTATENKDTPSLSQSQESAADVSPPPTSEASQAMTPQEVFQEHKGIKLKSRTSMNFGAPLGQLR